MKDIRARLINFSLALFLCQKSVKLRYKTILLKNKNGSTSENVYADTACTKKIGSLDPRESCDCFGIFNDRAMVRYNVSGTSNYKIGFCKWLGGVK